jgi:hypothetical protein
MVTRPRLPPLVERLTLAPSPDRFPFVPSSSSPKQFDAPIAKPV